MLLLAALVAIASLILVYFQKIRIDAESQRNSIATGKKSKIVIQIVKLQKNTFNGRNTKAFTGYENLLKFNNKTNFSLLNATWIQYEDYP